MKAMTTSLNESAVIRWGAAMIGLLCLLYGLMILGDFAEDWRRRAQSAEAEFDRRRRIVEAAPLWSEARKQAEADAIRLQAAAWRAPSDGQARATIQDWLSNSLITGGAERPSVRIDRAAPAQGVGLPVANDLVWVQVTVGGAMPLPALERWLAQIAGSDRLIVVDRLRVQSQPAARFEAVLLTPAQFGGAP